MEFTGSGLALVQDQSQEPQSRVHDSCIGSVDILSEDVGLLGLQWIGINFKVPTACKPSGEKIANRF